MLTLDSLEPGVTATIAEVAGDDAIASRLLEMGLIEGTRIEFLGRAPLGDPLQCYVRGFRLALRRAEAQRITVQLTSVPLVETVSQSRVEPVRAATGAAQ